VSRRGVLLVDHGSRRPEANELVETLARALAAHVDGAVRVAHLEMAEPTIEQGVAACVADGATEITVLPCFLAPGRHTLEDVPARAEAAASRHLGVSVRVAEPVGTHPLMVEILRARLAETEGG